MNLGLLERLKIIKRDFFTYVSSKRKEKETIGSLRGDDGQLLTGNRGRQNYSTLSLPQFFPKRKIVLNLQEEEQVK